MFLMQVSRAADDEPLEKIHVSPCHDLVLRGKNVHKIATMHSIDSYIDFAIKNKGMWIVEDFQMFFCLFTF